MDNTFDDLLSEDLALAPSGNALATIASLAEEQLQIEAEIADLEAQLKDKQKRLNKISGEEIPAAMTAAGVESFVLKSSDPNFNGASVKVKPGVSMSLTESIKPGVIRWLRDNNYDDIISNQLTVNIPKGYDVRKVDAIRAGLERYGLEYKQAENVNTATMKSLYTEQVEKGVPLNPSDFGAYHYTKTDITLPKPKAPRAPRKK